MRLLNLTFDCADAAALAGFWSAMQDPEGNEFCVGSHERINIVRRVFG